MPVITTFTATRPNDSVQFYRNPASVVVDSSNSKTRILGVGGLVSQLVRTYPTVSDYMTYRNSPATLAESEERMLYNLTNGITTTFSVSME